MSAPVCPVCSSTESTVYVRGRGHALTREAFGQSRTDVSISDVLRCGACGLGYSRSRPSEAELAELYRTMDVTAYESEAPGRWISARSCLEILTRRYSRPPGRLLEVGCASGRFLSLAAERGWRPVGIEPSSVLCREARERLNGRGEILESTLEAASLPPASFDAVAMWDVLEHVPDPVGLLRQAASLLDRNGLLLLDVPDIASLPARLLGRRWPLLLPEHLNYFTRASLLRAAESAGLRHVWYGRRRAAFTLRYVLRRLSQHHIPGTAALGRACADTRAGNLILPMYMGELCAVFLKP